MDLKTEIKYLKGVGPKLGATLNKLGIFCLQDFLYYFPKRYEDRRKAQSASQIPELPDNNILLKGKVIQVEIDNPRPSFYIVKAILRCQTSKHLFKAIWFNQKFMQKILQPDQVFFISGKVTFNTYSKQYEVNVEDYELVTSGKNVEIVVPFYGLTDGLYQKKIRALVQFALENYLSLIKDPLGLELVSRENLLELKAAIQELHFPTDRERWKIARRRLVFDEFFYIELSMAIRYFRSAKNITGIIFNRQGELLDQYLKQLPYQFTGAQTRVLGEVLADMGVAKPMNRMVQGDVGSGKTDIALVALLCAVQNGYQAAIMVPTTVLAEQHYIKISSRLKNLPVKTLLLLGRHTAKEKKELQKQIEAKAADIIIGTHSLIQEEVKFAKLGLVIIDEQHRFGVVQRQELKAKGDENCDLLVMTATPIPRTLALTVYGDLDRSIIDELPPGRQQIKTYWVKPGERKKVYEFCRQELQKNNQVYIVYPLVEESEKVDLKAAVESFEFIKANIFPEYPTGLLHGRLKEAEKEIVLNKFRAGEIKVLVSTTVIEVGVDVPQATVMVIENANRFGLSQLHQLRGRVGRGKDQAYCFLLGESSTPETKKRLETMVQTTDGFKIAEADLEIRGPGDMVGVRQAGLPDLTLADLIKDETILKQARELAFQLVEQDVLLAAEKNYLLKQELIKRNRGLVDYILLN